MAHKILDNGTAYKIIGGKVMDAGTVYDIDHGKVMDEGTVYDILFAPKTVITITGSGMYAGQLLYAYATIDGVQYSSAAELEVPVGTPIYVFCKEDLNGEPDGSGLVRGIYINDVRTVLAVEASLYFYPYSDTNIVLGTNGLFIGAAWGSVKITADDYTINTPR